MTPTDELLAEWVRSRDARPLASAVWWEAARRFPAGRSFALFLGMTGAAGTTPLCRIGCRCREIQLLEQLRDNLPLAGVRALAVPAHRVLAELGAGRPIVWQRPGSIGLLPAPQSGIDLRSLAIQFAGRPAIVAFDLAGRGETEYFRASPAPYLYRLVSARRAASLAEMAARALAPSVPHMCARARRPIWATDSPAAVEAIAVWMESRIRMPRCWLVGVVGSWRASILGAQRYLDELAGSRKEAVAARLRRAAGLFGDAAVSLDESSRPESGRRRRRAWEGMRAADRYLRAAVDLLLEAAVLASRLPHTTQAVLLQRPEMKLEATGLSEMIYLARSGTRPFRLLAARRLAGGQSAQATATLSQLLVGEDLPTVFTAALALGKQRPDETPEILRKAAESIAGAALGGEGRARALGAPETRALLTASGLRALASAPPRVGTALSDGANHCGPARPAQ